LSWTEIDADMTPYHFVDALMRHQEFVAAIEFLSHALPARESTWWSCLCIQEAFGDSLEGGMKTACQAAVQWVLWPTEENRLLAKSHAEAVGHAGAPGAAATAAGIAGASGSLTSARAVANAVKLSSVQSPPAKIADTQRRYVDLAIGIAQGKYM